jgi:hypothetical protein
MAYWQMIFNHGWTRIPQCGTDFISRKKAQAAQNNEGGKHSTFNAQHPTFNIEQPGD